MKPQTPSGYEIVLKNGTMRSAFGGRSRLKPLPIHAKNSWMKRALSGAETENAR